MSQPVSIVVQKDLAICVIAHVMEEGSSTYSHDIHSRYCVQSSWQNLLLKPLAVSKPQLPGPGTERIAMDMYEQLAWPDSRPV